VIPRIERTFEEFLLMVGLREENWPQGATYGWLSRLYGIVFGQIPLPELEDFLENMKLSDILCECGLTEEYWVGQRIRSWHSMIMEYYMPPPKLYYSDFLETCGLTAKDLELTKEDLRR